MSRACRKALMLSHCQVNSMIAMSHCQHGDGTQGDWAEVSTTLPSAQCDDDPLRSFELTFLPVYIKVKITQKGGL
jgi:hypothetical protein